MANKFIINCDKTKGMIFNHDKKTTRHSIFLHSKFFQIVPENIAHRNKQDNGINENARINYLCITLTYTIAYTNKLKKHTIGIISHRHVIGIILTIICMADIMRQMNIVYNNTYNKS